MPRLATALLFVLAFGAASAAQELPPIAPVAPLPPPFPEWLASVREEAAARGIRPEILEQALDGVEPVAQILDRDRSQAEFTLDLAGLSEAPPHDVHHPHGAADVLTPPRIARTRR